MKSEPDYEVPPPMWCTGDLVIIKIREGRLCPGTIVETSREWINHIGGVWSYTALVDGRLVRIDESSVGEYKIMRKAADAEEDTWGTTSASSRAT